MEQLIEDYGRRLKTVIEEIAKGGNDLTINRLGTKASCYRTFISELNRALTIPCSKELKKDTKIKLPKVDISKVRKLNEGF
jgi:hypothetical protein|tara:strand:- start:3937 stop:4179 length:243 start_codon:yes stop_codon:yes gene_type:complete